MPALNPPELGSPGRRPAKKAASRKGAATGGSPPGGGYTAATWAKELLRRLGAPETSANVEAIVSWEAAEGGHWNNTAYFNPLNTTQDAPGATSMNSVGVKAYTSWEQGLDATVKTLENGYYGHIIGALKQGSDPNAVAQAVVNSPWGTKQISVGGNTNYGTGSVDTSQRTVAAGTDAAGVGSGGLGTPAPLTRRGYVDQLDSQYGYLSAFTKIPAVKRILTQAARNGWSQDRMLAALEKTAWWKNTTATSRSWKALQATDPGEANRQLNQRVQQIQQEAKSTLGYHLDPDRAQHLANTSIAADWSQAQIQHAIGAEFKYAGAKQTYEGAAGQTVAQLQAIAKQYVVPLSQDTIEKYAKQILEGTYTTDDFQAYAQQQAESLYPTLKSALKSGQTVVQWADPYVQLASQILERPADQFNLANPRWSKALLQPQPDGERKAMDLADWADYLRSQPEYKDTNQAKAATADFGLALVNAFGKVSTPSTGNLGPTAINFGAT